MYYSAGSVGKTVLLTVHLDPREHMHWCRSCPATSPGWSCWLKGHRPPWGPPASHQEARAAYLGVFSEALPAGLWVMAALSNRLGVFVACGAVGVPRCMPVPLQHLRLHAMVPGSLGEPRLHLLPWCLE